MGNWVRQLRLHQWAKNTLLFVPAIASFKLFEGQNLGLLLLSFLSFGLVASSVYIFNDFLDLKNDREHPIKKNRPMAAGKISVAAGLSVSVSILLLGLAVGYVVGTLFLLVLSVYVLATLLYASWLKRVSLVDCILLAGLYTLRVIAGGAATGIAISFWLLTFSAFFFLSIAWVKRYAELEAVRSSGSKVTPGRGYSVSDMPLILSFGIASAFLAVLIFALYLDSSVVRVQYALPQLGWLAIPLLMYVIGRMWFKAHRGQMNEDPMLFLFRDVPGWISILLFGLVLILAHIGVSF